MSDKNDDAIYEAEKQVRGILSALEAETQTLIDSIEIVEMDVSKIGDDRQRIRRRVRITTKQIPGADWL